MRYDSDNKNILLFLLQTSAVTWKFMTFLACHVSRGGTQVRGRDGMSTPQNGAAA